MPKSTASTKREKDTQRSTVRKEEPDAIALLKADHRQVEGWFEEFEKARAGDRKQELAKSDLRGAKGSYDHRRGDFLSRLL